MAEAALADTLQAVANSTADRRILALDGAPGPWLPEGFEIVAQVEGPLQRRLAAAWAAAGGPGVQIGMDTPQVTADELDLALDTLSGTDAVLGPALDGGWWLLGLQRSDPRIFSGIRMSRSDTGAHQLARLQAMGLRVGLLSARRDLDTFEDALAISADHPGLATATAVGRLMASAGRRGSVA